ncbi:MAG: TRAP transporter substrate-binding protein [Geminicoccaceae bacterium]|nr:TRAP transporter substrate-binding protein [Geminicoccaceae bacterium]MCX7630195.1 TRAP transporter substrate-binding protein [Geminicoccaceae bacterium]MDW8125523.1 TRAP transporter substrate-binding protein [Geminicoccaceae bacterium]MDW8341456.1 TRAP transporter substrate-binding protein [Geminicoccaceae bacterium]
MATRRSFVLATVVLGALACSGSARAAAEYRWKFQSFWQPNTVNQQAFERFAARVNERSRGRIEIEALPVNAVVPPGEMLDAVRAGIIHGTNGGTGYYVGKDPAFALLADLNCAWENPQQLVGWFYEGGGNELARELYARFGAFWLGPVLWGMESIPSKKPLRSIADFKGLKMRAPEGLGAAIWAKLGVGVITLPGTEVYTALERGRIEATDWGTLGMNDQLGYGKIAPYAIYPGIHSMPASDVTIKLDIWEKLPQDLKTVLLEETVEFNRYSLEVNEKLDREMVAKRDPATLINWGPKERRELREVARTVWEEWGNKSPMARKIYDSYLAYMRKIGLL